MTEANKAIIRRYYADLWNVWNLEAAEHLIAEGNKVVARRSYRGTCLVEIFGVAPTGKCIEYPGIATFGVGDEEI